jgi:carboxyl-terminal processing protease
MGNKKLQVWLPLIFSIVLIGGMFFGFKLRENTASGTGFFRADKKTALQEILDLVKQRYVDRVNLDSLQNSAIDQMMSRLDPHSRYIPPSHLQSENEDLAGNFDGIGVEFNLISDTVHIVHVLEGGPSDKAGLQVGDKIIKVNGETIAGRNNKTDDIKNKIRGESGSTVKLTLLRKNEQKEISIKRGKIPIPAVDAAYLLNDTTGYIKLNKFSETAYEEFMRSLEDLQKNKITDLVLDLRGNGGGLMGEAVDIADEFLSDDKLVVYTQGANTQKEEYKCRRPGLFEEGDLVVLVDELSASASEVLAGALQDWCRATIVGRRTFGKGLVQKQYGLSDGGALRLTIARYYTPKGRSIQRPYESGKEKYLEEIRDRFENGDPIHPDTSKLVNGKVYRTQCGDSVYGGGGITPKYLVGRDTGSLHKNVALLYEDGIMSTFIYNYYLQHLDEINKFATPEEFIKKFNNEEGRWQELVDHAAKENIDLTQISADDKAFIQRSMKAQLARYKWRSEGYYEALNNYDPAIKKALEVLTKQKR